MLPRMLALDAEPTNESGIVLKKSRPSHIAYK
jgi:hypothetical protein